MQETFIILKPDCVKRKLVSTVLGRLELEFDVIVIKTLWLNPAEVDFLYGRYAGEPFYKDLSDFMQNNRSHLVIVRGMNVVKRVRKLIGAGNEVPGTIRGDYANHDVKRENIIHASDSVKRAQEEINFFFTYDEQIDVGLV